MQFDQQTNLKGINLDQTLQAPGLLMTFNQSIHTNQWRKYPKIPLKEDKKPEQIMSPDENIEAQKQIGK